MTALPWTIKFLLVLWILTIAVAGMYALMDISELASSDPDDGGARLAVDGSENGTAEIIDLFPDEAS